MFMNTLNYRNIGILAMFDVCLKLKGDFFAQEDSSIKVRRSIIQMCLTTFKYNTSSYFLIENAIIVFSTYHNATVLATQ